MRSRGRTRPKHPICGKSHRRARHGQGGHSRAERRSRVDPAGDSATDPPARELVTRRHTRRFQTAAQ